LNFSILTLLLFLVSACGVKGDPVHPDGAVMPSIPSSQYKTLNVKQPLNESVQP